MGRTQATAPGGQWRGERGHGAQDLAPGGGRREGGGMQDASHGEEELDLVRIEAPAADLHVHRPVADHRRVGALRLPDPRLLGRLGEDHLAPEIRAGRRDEGQRDLGHVLAADAGGGVAHRERVRLHARLGQINDAVDARLAPLAIQVRHPEPRVHRGRRSVGGRLNADHGGAHRDGQGGDDHLAGGDGEQRTTPLGTSQEEVGRAQAQRHRHQERLGQQQVPVTRGGQLAGLVHDQWRVGEAGQDHDGRRDQGHRRMRTEPEPGRFPAPAGSSREPAMQGCRWRAGHRTRQRWPGGAPHRPGPRTGRPATPRDRSS